MLRIYNTLTEKKEVVAKPKGRPLHMFVCGPTVYENPHIGNARTFVAFDLFVRYLRCRGFKLFYLQNITDVDDKIIARARERGTSWKDISREYEKIFLDNVKKLGIKSVDKYARATDHIPEIVRQVKTLIAKKHAYLIPGDGYYFDLKTFPDYGKLAHRTVMQAEDATSRIDTSDKKRNKGDFALWKLWNGDETEPRWKTELGEGRPGWHIEDTAITEKFFGPQYDIHGGAIDLKFPHHEAEIAQQESASGKKPFVKIWMHAGFMTVNGQKMSKSLGNFVSIDELLRQYPAEVFRMAVFMHDYRSPLDYSESVMHAAQKNLAEIKIFIAKLGKISANKKSKTADANFGKLAARLTTETKKKFFAALDDDFNSPAALAAIFRFLNEIQSKIWTLDGATAKKMAEVLKNALEPLGFAMSLAKIPPEIKELATEREKYRGYKQFAESDALRQKIFDLGYVVEDTPAGPLLYPRT